MSWFVSDSDRKFFGWDEVEPTPPEPQIMERKRRRETDIGFPPRRLGGASQLGKRISRLAKKMKVMNPLHMFPATLNTVILSTTTFFTELLVGVGAGDGPAERFANQCQLKRVIIKCVIIPGSTQVVPVPIRITIFRAESGSTLAATVVNLNTSVSPVAATTITQVIMDRYLTVSPTIATQAYPLNLNMSVKVPHHQKFSGVAAGTNAGESMYLSIISNTATGTAAPVIVSGFFEEWFQP